MRFSGGGRWLFQGWSWREGRSLSSLLLVDEEGSRVWEVEDRLRLLEADAVGRLYSRDPEGLDPAEVRIARPR